MAGINPNIILGIQQPQIQQADPLERYGKSLALQGLLGQQDLQGLQLQTARQGMEDEAAVRSAYQQSGGDSAILRQLLNKGGQYKAVQGLDKAALENRAKEATIGKDVAAAKKSDHEVAMDNISRGAAVLATAVDQPTYDAARRNLALTFGPQSVANLPEQFDPMFVKAKISEGMKIAEQLKAQHDQGTLLATQGKNATDAANQPFAVGPNGPVANADVQAFQLDKAKKSAPNVNVKTEVKTGESLAAQVGPMMKDSTAIAEGAVKQVDAARRVVQAVDSGKIIAGPGASPRLLLAQIGETLGVGGKDEAEKIANTRAAVRAFAELTLQGRQQMKGQGAITESEGKLAEKAMSGDIDSLTAPEIKQLAKASERSARFNHAEHTRKLDVMRQNPALNQVAPFYEGPKMPAEEAATPAPSQLDIDAELRRRKVIR